VRKVTLAQKRPSWRGTRCSVPGCPRRARCKGLCTKHYNRKYEEKQKEGEHGRKM